jgi:hypothetical protein
MSMTIALSDVLSGTDQGIVLGTGPDGAPSILAWRPQILGVQAPPVALHGFLQTVLAHALAWPDGRACGVVAVLPAVLMAAIADHPRLEAVDGAAPTFAADLTARLESTLAAGAVLGLTVPADGSALLTSATIWSRLSALPLACPPLLLTAGAIAPPRHLAARCCQIALQPTYPTHSTLAADDNGRWVLTPWSADGKPTERLVLTLGRPEALDLTRTPRAAQALTVEVGG